MRRGSWRVHRESWLHLRPCRPRLLADSRDVPASEVYIGAAVCPTLLKISAGRRDLHPHLTPQRSWKRDANRPRTSFVLKMLVALGWCPLLIDNIQVQACPSARARERLLFGTVKHYRQSVCADYVIGLVRIEATEQVICAK